MMDASTKSTPTRSQALANASASAAKSNGSERLKNEVIHEQSMVMKLLRVRLEKAEAEVEQLSKQLRTLELKHKVLERTNTKLEQEYEQFKLSAG